MKTGHRKGSKLFSLHALILVCPFVKWKGFVLTRVALFSILSLSIGANVWLYTCTFLHLGESSKVQTHVQYEAKETPKDCAS